MKFHIRIFSLLLVLCLLIGCGSSRTSSGSSASSAASGTADYDMMSKTEQYADDPQIEEPSDANGIVPEELSARKLIRSASLSIETEQFDDSVALLEQQVAALGGYVEASSVSGSGTHTSRRNADYTLRLPSAQLEVFLQGASGLGTVVQKEQQTQEITAQYYDTEARLTTLKVQEQRLLAILDKAESLSDVLELENSLSDVRYQIESLTTTLKKYDGLVDYATVELSIRETTGQDALAGNSLGQRIGRQFSLSLSHVADNAANLLVLLLGGLPQLLWGALWLALLAVIVVAIVRKRRGKPVFHRFGKKSSSHGKEDNKEQK